MHPSRQGRRSGVARSTRNLGPQGSSIGPQRAASWPPPGRISSLTCNLQAEPRAEVGYRGRTVPVVAREAEGDEREAVWARGCELYAGYQAYAHRIDRRPIHVMVLEPSAGG